MRGVDAPALRTCSGESQENCSGASCSTLSAACSDAADCSGAVSWSIAPSSCANFVSPTMGTPYFRAFCALPLMESGLAATSSAHFFVTPPTSRPAAVARWAHLSRGMSIAPVSAMRSPGWRENWAGAVPACGSQRCDCTSARSTPSASATAVSSSRSSSVATPSDQASMASWRVNSSLIASTSSAPSPEAMAVCSSWRISVRGMWRSTSARVSSARYVSSSFAPLAGRVRESCPDQEDSVPRGRVRH